MRPVRISGALAALMIVLMVGAPAAAQGPYPPGIDADSIRIATVGSASIAAGGAHSCAITSVGELYCWGDDSSGQVGDGAQENEAGVAVPVLSDVIQVDAGRAHTCALNVSGNAFCWGDGADGQLGDGTLIGSDAPTRVETLTNRVLVEITTGAQTSCAIDDEGLAWCWGDGSPTPVPVSRQSGMSDPVVDIAAGADLTCAITTIGGSFCWRFGEEPAVAFTGIVAREIVVGGSRACVLDAEGLTHCDKSTREEGPFDLITAGGDNTCGLNRAGRAFCWDESRQMPKTVDIATPLRDIDAGDNRTCAFDVRGYAWCWGSGADAVPVQVGGLPRPPAAATGLRLKALDGGLRVSWRPPADLGSGAFMYYWATTSGYEASCTIEDVTATGCELTGLENGRNYDVAVIVMTRDGLTVSDFVTAAPRADAPLPVDVPVTAPPTLVLQPGPGGGLPVTGVSPIALFALGTLLLGIGMAALLVRKR